MRGHQATPGQHRIEPAPGLDPAGRPGRGHRACGFGDEPAPEQALGQAQLQQRHLPLKPAQAAFEFRSGDHRGHGAARVESAYSLGLHHVRKLSAGLRAADQFCFCLPLSEPAGGSTCIAGGSSRLEAAVAVGTWPVVAEAGAGTACTGTCAAGDNAVYGTVPGIAGDNMYPPALPGAATEYAGTMITCGTDAACGAGAACGTGAFGAGGSGLPGLVAGR